MREGGARGVGGEWEREGEGEGEGEGGGGGGMRLARDYMLMHVYIALLIHMHCDQMCAANDTTILSLLSLTSVTGLSRAVGLVGP